MFYIGCPDCKKKVQEDPIGYRCEQCSKTHTKADAIYMLNAKIADSSSNTYISFPRELGDAIMNGKSASEFKDMKENMTPENLKVFFQECYYQVLYSHS